MQLVERHVIKLNHPFYAEIDRLSFLTKNLYNAANYIYRQNFLTGKSTDAKVVYHTLKNTDDYKAIPAKVAQEVLRMLLRAWSSYYASINSFQKSPQSFKSPPRIPNYQGTFGDRSDGRYVVSYNKQAYSKRALKKGFVHPSGTEIMIKTKVREIEQVRFIPKKTCYVVEVVYNREEPQKKFSPSRIASIDLGLNNLATLTTNIPDYQPLIYDGRALKSANQYTNKQNAILRKNLKNKKQVTKSQPSTINYEKVYQLSIISRYNYRHSRDSVRSSIGNLVTSCY